MFFTLKHQKLLFMLLYRVYHRIVFHSVVLC